MIHKLADKIATHIHEHDQTHDVNDIQFGLVVFFNYFFVTLLASVLSLILGTFIQTTIGIIAFLIFRSLTGGYHLKTAEWCIVVSGLAMCALPYLGDLNRYYDAFLWTSAICLLITIIFAPFDPISSFLKNHGLLCKVLAIIFILVNLLVIHSSTILAAMEIQCLLLIHLKKR